MPFRVEKPKTPRTNRPQPGRARKAKVKPIKKPRANFSSLPDELLLRILEYAIPIYVGVKDRVLLGAGLGSGRRLASCLSLLSVSKQIRTCSIPLICDNSILHFRSPLDVASFRGFLTSPLINLNLPRRMKHCNLGPAWHGIVLELQGERVRVAPNLESPYLHELVAERWITMGDLDTVDFSA